jgi:hypothetical protein
VFTPHRLDRKRILVLDRMPAQSNRSEALGKRLPAEEGRKLRASKILNLAWTLRDLSAEKGSSPAGCDRGGGGRDQARDRPRNQSLKMLERPGQFADLPEVVFVVVLVTISHSVRISEEMSALAQHTVTQTGGTDRTA